MKKAISKLLPRSFKDKAKKVLFKARIKYDIATGKRHRSTPLDEDVFIGDGDFESVGRAFFEHFKTLAGLKPSDNVLDVGCGQGRMAAPLTRYLTGYYQGFDIVKDGVLWCRKTISKYHRNFNFNHADVYNKEYNPTGTQTADKYKFPYADNYFDFVFLTSVFTHMLDIEVENYLSEITRVMKPGGRCLITCFLLNDESKKLVSDGRSTQNFQFKRGNYSITKEEVPEAAVGFEEPYFTELFNKNGLTIKSINYGSWCGRVPYFDYQDIIIATKN